MPDIVEGEMIDQQNKPNTKLFTSPLGTFFFAFLFVSFLSLGGAALFSYGNFTVYQQMAKQQSEEIETLKILKSDLSGEIDLLHKGQMADKLDVSQQFALLREELIKMKNQREIKQQVLGVNVSPTPSLTGSTEIKGIVQLNKKWKTADVFQEPVASSKIVGQAVGGKLYFIYDSKSGWNKIELSDSQQGWIQVQLLDEI